MAGWLRLCCLHALEQEYVVNDSSDIKQGQIRMSAQNKQSKTIKLLIKIVMTISKYVTIKLSNTTSVMKRVFKQSCESCRNFDFSAATMHCLYDHEMSNVPNYIKVPMIIIAALTTMVVIMSRANAKRSQDIYNE